MNSYNENDMHNQNEQEEVVDQEVEQVEAAQISDLEVCQQEAAMWKDQYARISADFDNYKKRMDREQIQWMQTAQTMVIKDLLPVVDNFERALSQKTDDTANLYVGIEMVYKSVLQTLAKYGVKEFAEYKQFDPELHEALMHAQSADHESGQIVQVLEKGFMIKDKVLRPAKVTVAQ
ncbi:nucleotide exchange factor GrpE [Candidatus Chromulinivorax destructor]|uniref:Protein GrpE n=1 Tax=Candidatus Chromulinivorax destructor TaxID=2066483 RepID=A0A345ZCT4_9BACT|nr:nucleotide exchange factor GrpE [Candidatus Chromulinivorax destructor]AXK61101.1 nucleotide exchange factor GrpE [Candidatus Chromulinivorax destructor]